MPPDKRLRKRICHAIASVVGNESLGAKNASSEGIDSQLDKIFASSYEVNSGEGSAISDSDDNGDNVTPLMVACDKCCSQALVYFRNQIISGDQDDDLQTSPKAITTKHLVEAWGHPNEESSCGNSAAHHAMSAGFCEGLALLACIWDCIEKESQNDHYLPLLSQANHNGDTPLMMACVSGHVAMIKYVLESSMEFALSTKSENMNQMVEETWQLLKDTVSMKNYEECTALNLACGHGHTDIAKFLIQSQCIHVCWNSSSIKVNILSGENDNTSQKEVNDRNNAVPVCECRPLINLSYEDVEFCKTTIESLAAGIKFMKQQKQDETIKEFNTQLTHARKCLAILEYELERISTETAKELLIDMGETKQIEFTNKLTIANGSLKPKGRGKKKKKQKRKNTRQNQKQDAVNVVVGDKKALENSGDTCTNETKHHTTWENVKDRPEKELSIERSSVISPFITLHDGSVVSTSQKANYASSLHSDVSPLDDTIPSRPMIKGIKPKTLERILRSTTSSPANDDDIAAIMEYLCLDPTMLLLSPHGMAMEMSPCQLDAIESILSHQLNATKEAQKIQNRLLDT